MNINPLILALLLLNAALGLIPLAQLYMSFGEAWQYTGLALMALLAGAALACVAFGIFAGVGIQAHRARGRETAVASRRNGED